MKCTICMTHPLTCLPRQLPPLPIELNVNKTLPLPLIFIWNTHRIAAGQTSCAARNSNSNSISNTLNNQTNFLLCQTTYFASNNENNNNNDRDNLSLACTCQSPDRANHRFNFATTATAAAAAAAASAHQFLIYKRNHAICICLFWWLCFGFGNVKYRQEQARHSGTRAVEIR